MATNQPHTKRDAGGDKADAKKKPGNPEKGPPGKAAGETAAKGKKDSGGGR